MPSHDMTLCWRTAPIVQYKLLLTGWPLYSRSVGVFSSRAVKPDLHADG
jgi:hypothetical protein